MQLCCSGRPSSIWCHHRWCLPWRTTKELFRSVCRRPLCQSVNHNWYHCWPTIKRMFQSSHGHEFWSVANSTFDLGWRLAISMFRFQPKHHRWKHKKLKLQSKRPERRRRSSGGMFLREECDNFKSYLLCHHLMALEWALVRNPCPHVPQATLKVLWVRRTSVCSSSKSFQIYITSKP